MTIERTIVALALAGLFAIGCEGAPANVAGNYQVAITNGANGCAIARFNEGEQSTGISLTMTQDTADAQKVTGVVGGVSGGVLQLWLGSNSFTGTVSGSTLDMEIKGTRPMADKTCAYTANARATASVEGDVIMGTIRYFYATNNTPDCGTKSTCETLQSFNGTRPPTKQ